MNFEKIFLRSESNAGIEYVDLGTNLDIIDCLGGSVVQCIRSWTSLDMEGRLDLRELREDLKVS